MAVSLFTHFCAVFDIINFYFIGEIWQLCATDFESNANSPEAANFPPYKQVYIRFPELD